MITIVNSEDVRIEKPVAEALLQLVAAVTTGSTVTMVYTNLVRIVTHEALRDAVTTFRGHPEAMYYLCVVAKAAKDNPFSQYKEE